MRSLENFTENLLEEAAIEILQGLGYDYVFAPDISCDGKYPERKVLSANAKPRQAVCCRGTDDQGDQRRG